MIAEIVSYIEASRLDAEIVEETREVIDFEPSAAAVWSTFLVYPGWAIALVVALYLAVKRGARIGVYEGLRSVGQPEQPTSQE